MARMLVTATGCGPLHLCRAREAGTTLRGTMIDLTAEKPLSLWRAAELIPPARNGKRTNASTIFRWVRDGATGPDGQRVYLEALKLPGRWLTTAAAVQRFLEALTPQRDARPATPRPSGRRAKASEKAGREPAKIGI